MQQGILLLPRQATALATMRARRPFPPNASFGRTRSQRMQNPPTYAPRLKVGYLLGRGLAQGSRKGQRHHRTHKSAPVDSGVATE
jgi:hypothetical protein